MHPWRGEQRCVSWWLAAYPMSEAVLAAQLPSTALVSHSPTRNSSQSRAGLDIITRQREMRALSGFSGLLRRWVTYAVLTLFHLSQPPAQKQKQTKHWSDISLNFLNLCISCWWLHGGYKYLEKGFCFQEIIFNPGYFQHRLPRWLSGKESVCDARDEGSIPVSESSPGEENGNSLQYSCLGNPMDRGTWKAIVYGSQKSQTQLRDYTTTTIPSTAHLISLVL